MNEINRENAKRISFSCLTLEECVKRLLEFRDKGQSVVFDFNGHKLYSCDVTMDKAYQEIVGVTKTELERRNSEKQAKIPVWIEKGKKFIYSENYKKWEDYIKDLSTYSNSEIFIDIALDTMEKLESGMAIEEVKTIFDEKVQDISIKKDLFLMEISLHASSIVLLFSKRGPEFFSQSSLIEDEEDKKNIVEKQIAENFLIEQKSKAVPIDMDLEKYRNDIKSSKFLYDIDIEKYDNFIKTIVKKLEDYKERGESVVITFNGHKLYSCDITLDIAYKAIVGMTKTNFLDLHRQEEREEMLSKLNESQKEIYRQSLSEYERLHGKASEKDKINILAKINPEIDSYIKKQVSKEEQEHFNGIEEMFSKRNNRQLDVSIEQMVNQNHASALMQDKPKLVVYPAAKRVTKKRKSKLQWKPILVGTLIAVGITAGGFALYTGTSGSNNAIGSEQVYSGFTEQESMDAYANSLRDEIIKNNPGATEDELSDMIGEAMTGVYGTKNTL
ncbi:MAG: hypothetical protein R3Y21_02575 [Mycoplasmatota bacterium]